MLAELQRGFDAAEDAGGYHHQKLRCTSTPSRWQGRLLQHSASVVSIRPGSTSPFHPAYLASGWKTWSHYECYKRLGVSLRELGARDMCIEHDVADRALAAPLHRLLLQHHALVIQRITRGLDEGEQTKLRLTSWHVHTSCAAHDVHMACEWGFLRWLEKDTRQNAFFCIESLRSSYAQLARNVIPWIQTVVAYADLEYPFNYELWVMIGLGDNVIDLMLSLDLRWGKSQLLVGTRWRGSDTVLQMISTALMGAWKYRT